MSEPSQPTQAIAPANSHAPNKTWLQRRLDGMNLCDRCTLIIHDSAGPNKSLTPLKVFQWSDQQCREDLLSNGFELNDLANSSDNNICPCCCNCLGVNAMTKFSEMFTRAIHELPPHLLQESTDTDATVTTFQSKPLTIYVSAQLPPILEVLRAVTKYTVSSKPLHAAQLPTFEETIRAGIRLLLSTQSPAITIVDQEQLATFKFQISANFDEQTTIAQAIYPPFQCKRKRRRVGDDHDNWADSMEVSQTDADKIMTFLRITFGNKSDVEEAFATDGSLRWTNGRNPIISMIQSIKSCLRRIHTAGSQLRFRWHSSLARYPVYLLGRYRKLARDVPQAPWTLDSNDRKGRMSVEEIIGEAVCKVLGASASRLHGCGREDIDVRCLGNGRPFVLEVLNSVNEADTSSLSQITNLINSRQGLNALGDVEVPMLVVTSKTTWETMQAAAEEKKKGYCCLVWTKNPITRDMLAQLEVMASADRGVAVDSEGRRCLELAQKTPLRVLHRRSALVRPKQIYDIETALLNEHFFVMRLVTAPGTYVKEFVHGDLGRTNPSICSIFKCQAEILQLDVIKLYDAFEGGAMHEGGSQEYEQDAMFTSTSQAMVKMNGMSWHDLKTMRIVATVKS